MLSVFKRDPYQMSPVRDEAGLADHVDRLTAGPEIGPDPE